jgi:predicted dehydrogenase
VAALRVLVVGCGQMGRSHARAYQAMNAFEIVGLVSLGPASRTALAAELGGDVPTFGDAVAALEATRPDCVSINTYPDTHAELAHLAIEAGAHVFIEKPLAMTVDEAKAIVALAAAKNRKLVVGYILRHHPSWTRFIDIAHTLGKPLVMRMNLNQQSDGEHWTTHKALMSSMAPIVDCGVHYVDVMCQMTRSAPVRVHAVGARLTDELNPGMYNYGQLQVVFNDGSVGWYEAGWGPMISTTAFFVKDVVGPKGCVSIVSQSENADDIESHTRAARLIVHHAERGPDGRFSIPDDVLDMPDEPDHQELCRREQAYFLRAIRDDINLNEHLADSVNSLRIVLAADQSLREGRAIDV